MLKRKYIHKDMADVSIYTARKLNDMAASLGKLARAFSDEIEDGGRLSREDGLAAMQASAAMICGNCNKCNLYAGGEKDDSYYLYYLIRAFEEKGSVAESDMPRLFSEICNYKREYMNQLNKNLGRATMNLSWKNRFMESRDAVVVQFRELALILEEFSQQMAEAVDITNKREEKIKKNFMKHKMLIENMLVLEYGNSKKEAFITVRTNNGRCVTAKEAAEILGEAMGSGDWCVAKDSKSLITRQSDTVRFVEEGKYRIVCGVAREPKYGENISGDSYTFEQSFPGQAVISLSDGMGSGAAAAHESRKVVELTQQLLETGFSARAALKLVNTVMLLVGTEQHPATIDLCCIDLHTGVLEAMKLGAAATFIMGEDGVELLESVQVPVGIINPVEPVLLSKKLWHDNRIVMVSDGVLDAIQGDDKELILREYIESMPKRTPQDMAERILNFALSFTGEAKDDMTVLTAGVWGRK